MGDVTTTPRALTPNEIACSILAIRGEEGRDAGALAAVLGEDAPIVVRMRLRANELGHLARRIREQ